MSPPPLKIAYDFKAWFSNHMPKMLDLRFELAFIKCFSMAGMCTNETVLYYLNSLADTFVTQFSPFGTSYKAVGGTVHLQHVFLGGCKHYMDQCFWHLFVLSIGE